MKSFPLLILFFLLITQIFAQNPPSSMSDQELKTQGLELQSLRQKKGHYQGATFDQEIDGFQGRKHRLMVALGEALGKPGTPAQKVIETMGKPDQLTPSLDEQAAPTVAVMPGPVVPSGTSTQSTEPNFYYLVYEWRGKHDYLWFQVDSKTENVLSSGWYNAFE
ncbi:uncharacterized protein VTP21DRAFT_5866 [Calcarisporiella thermophila]|uniref:uncharacterized protein n=1 Tax=Calcarisporiella thermophila TaxID=911321 RepID=UPI003744000E